MTEFLGGVDTMLRHVNTIPWWGWVGVGLYAAALLTLVTFEHRKERPNGRIPDEDHRADA